MSMELKEQIKQLTKEQAIERIKALDWERKDFDTQYELRLLLDRLESL